VGLWSVGLACLKGTGQLSRDPACLWIPGLTDLGGTIEQNGDCVCGSWAWQALGAQPCRVNIVQCCAGFRGVASKAEIVQGWRAQPSKSELLQCCAGLGSLAGKAEIVQGSGAWPSKMELLQGCAGLRGGRGCGLAEILNICGSLALRTPPTEILWVQGVGVWGSTALVGQKNRAGGSEFPQCVKQWLCWPMGWGLTCSACYSFSIWWGGEAFHELGVQSADVSALPGALLQSSMSPASCQSPWIMEVRRSMVVFWSPSLISPVYTFFFLLDHLPVHFCS
jgi:hypothetical protein